MYTNNKNAVATQKERKKERRKNILAVWQLSGSVLLQCLFTPLGV